MHAFGNGNMRRGLSEADFSQSGRNGFGDPLNAYPHSMAWFRDRLFVGTTRSNLCLLKASKIQSRIGTWPVECPANLYDQDMRAQIWSFDPARANGADGAGWSMEAQSPHIDANGEVLPRELGYRGMCVFKGRDDPADCLYVSTYAPARGFGARVLRSHDGRSFEEIPMPAGFDRSIITLRLLVPFKGRLFTSPTGRAGGDPNRPGSAIVFASENPAAGEWDAANAPNFGDPSNFGVFEMVGCGDYLYAGTGNMLGYQIWRTRAEGKPPFDWECVVRDGAYRGALNQGVASFGVHDGIVYAGSGIQHGGLDTSSGVGPAPPELIRIHPDGSWDLVVGRARQTPEGDKAPLSGFMPGFGNLFAGYFWRMESHGDWLYLGTFDWSLMLRYADTAPWPMPFRRMIDRIGVEELVANQAGADLFRSRDGENWLPVTTQGFGNPYNYGIRTMQSTPHWLAVGCVNPFAPKVAIRRGERFAYEHNPRGGLEIWLGDNAAI